MSLIIKQFPFVEPFRNYVKKIRVEAGLGNDPKIDRSEETMHIGVFDDSKGEMPVAVCRVSRASTACSVSTRKCQGLLGKWTGRELVHQEEIVNTAELTRFVTIESERQKGHMTRLLCSAVLWAMYHGYHYATAVVEPENPAFHKWQALQFRDAFNGKLTDCLDRKGSPPVSVHCLRSNLLVPRTDEVVWTELSRQMNRQQTKFQLDFAELRTFVSARSPSREPIAWPTPVVPVTQRAALVS